MGPRGVRGPGGSGSGGFVAPQVSRVPGPLAFVPSGQGPVAALLLLLLPLCLLEAERGQLCGGRAGGSCTLRSESPAGREGVLGARSCFMVRSRAPGRTPGASAGAGGAPRASSWIQGLSRFSVGKKKNPQTCAERQRTIIRSPIPGSFSRRFILFHMHFRLSVVFSYALWLANAVLRFKKKKMTL